MTGAEDIMTGGQMINAILFPIIGMIIGLFIAFTVLVIHDYITGHTRKTFRIFGDD